MNQKETAKSQQKLSGIKKPVGLILLVSLGYPIMLILTFIINIIGLDSKNWRRYLATVCVMCSTGWLWNIYALNHDSNLLAWFFFPWNNTGIELFNMDLLDYCFYPVCGIMFLRVFKYLDDRIPDKFSSIKGKYVLICIYSVISILVLTYSKTGGCLYSLVIAGIIPGIIGLFLTRRVKLSVFFFGGFWMILFASMWDIFAVSVIPEIKGFEGTAQWMYKGLIEMNDAVIPYKSNFFIQDDWAWIENNPIETSYFLAIASQPWLYSIYEVVFKRNNIWSYDN